MDSNTLVISLLKLKSFNNNNCLSFIKDKGFDIRKCSNELDSLIDESRFLEFKNAVASANNDLSNGVLNRIKSICIFDPSFSPLLYNTKNNPCLHLYYKGDISLINQKCITVVGSENVHQADLDNAYKLGEDIALSGMCLVTDLSFGCNTSAINGCISQGGRVILVFSADLHSIQPFENKDLVEKVLAYGGLIVSEYPLGYPYSYSCRARKYELLELLSSMIIVVKGSETHELYNTLKKATEDKRTVIAINESNLDIIDRIIDIEGVTADYLIELFDNNQNDIKGEQLTLF